MKKVEYKCNLCAEVKPTVELVCIYWTWDVDAKKNTYQIVDKLDASDKHLCKTCIEMISSLDENPK